MKTIITWGLIILIGYIALSFKKVRKLAEEYWYWIVMFLIAFSVSKFIALFVKVVVANFKNKLYSHRAIIPSNK